MSADNGVYILKSPKENGHEYRVIHACGIDNIQCNPDCQGFNTWSLKYYFGDAEVHFTQEEADCRANAIKRAILDDDLFLEYGICLIEIPFPFPGTG